MNSITCLKDIWGSDTNCCQFGVDLVNITSLAANHHADGLVVNFCIICNYLLTHVFYHIFSSWSIWPDILKILQNFKILS